MKPHEFITALDEKKIVAAIAEAERKTSGEIRVYISHKKREDALAAARDRFRKLVMTRTHHRNAVLIYFAPLTHKFAIVGDVGIHGKCGEVFWTRVVGAMIDSLKKNNFTQAILSAIEQVGRELAKHFPPEPQDRNELPNQIANG